MSEELEQELTKIYPDEPEMVQLWLQRAKEEFEDHNEKEEAKEKN